MTRKHCAAMHDQTDFKVYKKQRFRRCQGRLPFPRHSRTGQLNEG
jgi:hypothetical protein